MQENVWHVANGFYREPAARPTVNFLIGDRRWAKRTKLGLRHPDCSLSQRSRDVVIVTNKAGVVELGVKLTDVGSKGTSGYPSSSTR